MKHPNKTLRRVLLAAVLAVSFCVQALALPAYLIPGGSAVGVRLNAPGLVITGLEDGAAAQAAGLRCGDLITKCAGSPVRSAQALSQRLQSGEAVVLQVQRGGQAAEFLVQPARSGTRWCLGAQVRDHISGIGTVTFYDPTDGTFGALGHGVSGFTDARLLQIASGSLIGASVADVRRGAAGAPGELHGTFDPGKTLGSVTANTRCGLFGTAAELPQRTALPVAAQEQVHTGAATILANVQGEAVEEFSIRIEKLYPGAQNGRDLLLRIDDEALLEQTGGIVQGMSGSPILQDGRIVGAVTHVLVSDPERGYGILIENMLEAAA